MKPQMTSTNFTCEQLEKCAKRELSYRRRVYPRLVRTEAMSQETANREIAMMSAIAQCFEDLNQPRFL